MPDAVEMRIISVIDLANDPPIAVRFVRADRDRLCSLTRSIALRKRALAAVASRRAVKRKFTIWPFASIARSKALVAGNIASEAAIR